MLYVEIPRIGNRFLQAVYLPSVHQIHHHTHQKRDDQPTLVENGGSYGLVFFFWTPV
jgi:hypothetical protein